MDRRSFLSTSAAALGGLALLGPPAARASIGSPVAGAGADVPAEIGVQLYTVRDVMEGDFVGVLEAIHRMGYPKVEFFTYFDREPAVVRAVLDDIGLSAPATHVPRVALQNDLDRVIAAAQTVGHRFVVLPWLVEEERPTSLDGYRALAEELNGYGARMQQAGLRFAYHNHAFEFDPFGGDTPAYDVLLEETDPDLVGMELDLYWIVEAGHDPLDYFARYPGRFPLFHVKDRTADGAMTAVGQGAIDFAAIFAAAEQAGLVHAFVEHDNPEDALASIRASIAHVASLR